ncbi:preprotein translocase subunit SecE [Skermania sp. ID1734]|uniref:preprotein translocase subunit SecE n=1 Tax=Skermania sp. ID1734 TaxID=2597516 RepID=UPI00118014E5|nr:preprotein translocase subunit SecE [Skermania sp. ID1734]TSD95100.1 preprotein translocase subunit SecE [Skermania sp. ID1734]
MSDERDGTAAGAGASNGRTALDSREEASNRPSGKRPGRRSRIAEAESSATAVERPAKAGTKAGDKKVKAAGGKRPNIFKRLVRFLREVLTELRKVIWPNRKQMVTYTTVVLVFVIAVVAYISGLDVAFIKGVTWLFG